MLFKERSQFAQIAALILVHFATAKNRQI